MNIKSRYHLHNGAELITQMEKKKNTNITNLLKKKIMQVYTNMYHACALKRDIPPLETQ